MNDSFRATAKIAGTASRVQTAIPVNHLAAYGTTDTRLPDRLDGADCALQIYAPCAETRRAPLVGVLCVGLTRTTSAVVMAPQPPLKPLPASSAFFAITQNAVAMIPNADQCVESRQ
jgi:hypothetical protein